jgi:hypothetical protein
MDLVKQKKNLQEIKGNEASGAGHKSDTEPKKAFNKSSD